ncbi:MAG: hypothetical protein JWN00_1280 [Actinomycetia bacterium]|nr:hypothetical protein [Actinomycetes bacterium]
MRPVLFPSLVVLALATGCSSTATKAQPPVESASSAAPVATLTATASATPSPTTPAGFTAHISAVNRATVKYSWHPGCPVPVSGLRLIKMTYWGMDAAPHTGQMVVNATVAKDVVKVFKKVYAAKFPIRRMELVDVYKGSDFNSIEADNTSAFNCRAATGSTSWSQHAYGLAIDVNTCENPYVAADGTIAHPKCVKFGDRSLHVPGMIHEGDVVYRAFTSIGWGWGGLWNGTRDYQHFSSNGR